MANPFEDDMPKPVIKSKMAEENLPSIFIKNRIQYNPPEDIQHICVCNDILVIAMNKNKLLRLDINKHEQMEYEISKNLEDSIYNIFLDFSGHHLIISMSNGDNYYFPKLAKKPKLLNKYKGHLITSIGWNKNLSTDSTTSFILIGTSKGLIFEAELSISDEKSFFTQGPDIYFKQLFNFVKDKSQPITGLTFDCLSKNNQKNSKRYFIMITVLNRLYQLIGIISFEFPYFQPIFSTHDDLIDRFMEIPVSVSYSELKLFYPSVKSFPLHFGWMIAGGIYFGGVNMNPAEGVDAVSINTRLIRFPEINGNILKDPLSFLLTEFHILVLFSDRLVIINILTEEIVQVDNFNQTFGSLKKTYYDIKGTIWVASSNSIFKYKIFKENRHILKIYLEQNEFELAKEFCKNDSQNLQLVLTKEANYLYSMCKFKESAILYSQMDTSFEDIALKFSLLEDKEPLRIFLQSKLNLLSIDDRTQRTMIVLWLIEIWLNELGCLKDTGLSDIQNENRNLYSILFNQFRSFLSSPNNKDCLVANKQIIYDLLNCHGDSEDIIWFANLVSDFETMISNCIKKDDHRTALTILTKQIHNNMNLMYKFSPVLILHVPSELINIWKKEHEYLRPEKLIPSLIQYDQVHRNEKPNEAIRYLEFCAYDLLVKTKAIHNYLIAMYIKLEMFSQLLRYLQTQGQEADMVSYDLEYALRLCLESGEKRCCVHIYTTMGFYEQAVELALQFDIDFAKLTADKPSDNLDLKRKLWLQIARHVVEKEKDIKKAMEFLKDGSLIRIEDILPFFPEFVTIDHFKDAICSSLQQYNKNLSNLKDDINSATVNAQELRKKIHCVREQCSFVKNDSKCCICDYDLMQRSFYIFPCKHYFHTDCFINELMPFLDVQTRNLVKDLQHQISNLAKSKNKSLTKDSVKSLGRTSAELIEELDLLVAKECVYCGEIMINSIDMPFVEKENMQSVLKSWL